MQNGQNGQTTNDNAIVHIEDDMRSITDVIRGTGLAPPEHTEAQVTRDYGEGGARFADEVAAAIDRVCEQTIAEHFRAVEQLEEKAAEARRNAEHFATKLREYSLGAGERVSGFMEFCRQTGDAIEQHAKLFDEHVSRDLYPRAADKPNGKH